MAISEPIIVPQDTSEVRLERTWAQPRGFWGWFMNVHHTAIGVRFMVTSFIFFLLGGILAAMMRLQLSRPEGAGFFAPAQPPKPGCVPASPG